MVTPARELKPGSVGWSVDDIFNDPERRYRWETSRWELLDGIIVAPGFGPDTATRLIPGSTGWTVDDLRKPPFAEQWVAGRYELVNGVITEMAPAAFRHGYPIGRLIFSLQSYFIEHQVDAMIAPEADIFVTSEKYFIADAAVVERSQLERELETEDPADPLGGLREPPLLAIESISPGYAQHDLKIKKEAYAAFGIPNYWVVDPAPRELHCFRLQDGRYESQADAVQDGIFRPAVFPGFACPINDLFLKL